MLLLNWIPLTGQKTLMMCDFVLIDLVSDVIMWCAVLLWDFESCQFNLEKTLFFCVVTWELLGNIRSEELEGHNLKGAD